MITAKRTKLRSVVLALLLAPAFSFAATDETDAVIEQGRYLVHAGGCISCHQASEAKDAPLSGGRALDTPFGRFYAPNITPDDDTGIGNWTDEEFIAAFRHGRSPAGDNYYPAFPYPAYSGITDADLIAIKRYLDSLNPINNPNLEHDLVWYVGWRPLLGFWNALYFEAGSFVPNPAASDAENRGDYLVNHLGHCGDCHTPRGRLGAQLADVPLSGNPDGPEGDVVPSITNNAETGIGEWSADDIAFFLEIGMLPDGDFTGASMGEVIEHNTSHLTPEDRMAMAEYLKTIH